MLQAFRAPRPLRVLGRALGSVRAVVSLSCAALIAGIWIGLAYFVDYERKVLLEARAVNLDRLAGVFKEHAERTLAAASITLTQVETEYRQRGRTLDLARFLREREAELQPYQALGITDADGVLRVSNSRFRAGQHFRNLENYQHHLRHSGRELFVARPRIGPVTGSNLIFLSRRLERPGGAYDGYVTAGMNPDYFARFFRSAALGEDLLVLLIGHDGVIRAGSAEEPSSAPGLSPGMQLRLDLPRSGQGQWRGSIGPLPRIFSYATVSGYPLAILVGLSEATVLAPWERNRRIYAAVAAVASLAVIAIAALVILQLSRRARANARQRQSDERLQLIADNVPVMIMYTNREAKHLYANRRADEFYAGAGGSIVGRAIAEIVDEERRPAVGHAHRRALAGEMVRYQALVKNKAGAVRDLDVVMIPDPGEGGDARGVHTLAIDMTEQRRDLALIRLQLALTRALGEAAEEIEGVKTSIRLVCEAEGWDCGRWYAFDQTSRVARFVAGWSIGTPELERYLEHSRGFEYRPGEGLLGLALEQAEPLWTLDVASDPRTRFPKLARSWGVHSSCIVQVRDHGRVLGALSFGSQRMREPDTQLRDALSAIGEQIGQFIQRRRVEARLREDDARIRALVDSALESIVIADERQNIVAFNRAAETMFGRRAETAVGRPLGVLLPSRFREEHDRQVALFAARGDTARRMGTSRAVLGLRADGTEFPAEASITRFASGGEQLVAVMLRDLTEIARANQVILELNATLERRVTERTAELEAANKELEAFTYLVSHDLRTPARAINGLARIVREDFGRELPAEALTQLGRIERAATGMGEMVDGLLKLARVQRQTLTVAPVDLDLVAREIWNELAAAAPKQSCELVVEASLPTLGDTVLLRSLLGNLLGNARKYSRQNPFARVTLGISESGAFFVRDNGTGFDMRHAARLFTPFHRLHPEGDFEGTGVGLALCLRIVARHGGTIWAESAPGRGATFFFTLG